MTRKDYILIAETIRTIDRATFSIYDDVAEKLRANMAGHFAAMLERDNPRFDRARFLKACKP
jgi:hypothetical protein